ncbi:MAG TPA: amidohydrolase family protein [Alphaproteobacteria bacterium]|nr:amidohydrolase family protein [Alphaproteobacteria bacterium]
MAHARSSQSAAVRAKLDHPVIDGDGHWLEPVPIFLDYLRTVGGPSLVERFVDKARDDAWYAMSPHERSERRPRRPTWWGEPANTLDRATAMIPRLMYERLDDFGIDFALLYTSLGLFYINNPDEELRRAVCRAVNCMNAEMFRPYAHRIAPAAVVPVYTPQEAIEEATFAVRELGMKVVMISNHVRRPIPAFAREAVDVAKVPHYIDPLALDSAYDYDPFWARCVELKVAVTCHAGSMGWGGRESVTNFTYNHIGHFANANHTFAKALVIGGVVRRFPALRFAFLEGGVGWACNLLTDLIGHWEKRNAQAMEAHLRPTNLDVSQLRQLFNRYGGKPYEEHMSELLDCLSLVSPFKTVDELTEREYREQLDDFAAARVGSAVELRRQFAEHFFFGCESDDVITAWAFDKHGNHRLHPIFSSDVSHFDVTDMTEVLEEAYELVEHELITPDDFREFVFANAARLHTALNPAFFNGTVVEEAVAKLVSKGIPVEGPLVTGDN